MLDMVPEPNWVETVLRVISFLKSVREDLLTQDQGGAMMRVSNVVEMIDHILLHPSVAGLAFEFVEHNRRAIDIIALEQMMVETPPEQMNLFDNDSLPES